MLGLDDLRPHQRRRPRARLLFAEASQVGRDGEIRAIAEHGRRARQLPGFLGKPRQASQHRARRGPRAKARDSINVCAIRPRAPGVQRLQELAQK